MKTSLYAQLAEDVKSYIQNHALAPGDRLPAFPELCAQFGVSHATVRAALQVLTQEGVVESRPRQGLFVAHPKSNTKVSSDPRTIALVLSGEESAYEAGIIRGVMERGLEAGYQVIVASNASDVNVEAKQLEELREKVAGMIILPTHSSSNYGSYAKLLEVQMPWVFVDRGVAGLAASVVATDNELGGYLGAKHLLECGYSNLYAISAKPVTSIQERILGFRKALREAQVPQASSKVRTSPQFESSVGYSLTKEILAENRDGESVGLFLLDETLVLPCYAAVREAGLRIPSDVAVVSYDDISAKFFDPPLTAVRQAPHDMGVEAMKILVKQIESGKHTAEEVRLKPTLVVRNSTDVGRAVTWGNFQTQDSDALPSKSRSTSVRV